MTFPRSRLRRLRQNSGVRSLVRETELSTSHFMAPLFVVPGSGVRRPITAFEGQLQLSADMVVSEAKTLVELGVPSVLLFGVPERKDALGSTACDDHGVVQQAIRALKRELPALLVAADLCFCEYTEHGHCGVIVNDDVDNDLTLRELGRQAVSLARAGADIMAPSGMMDGMVMSIRQHLDEAGFQRTIIMSYAAKYASAFYGPFRQAVNSAPSFGDRRTYQMDPANCREALREVEEDIAEGADIVMVKPALAYLDVLTKVKERSSVPVAAYNVSGEYAMVKAAAASGLVDGERVMMEILLAIKRAGADIIITYFAREAAEVLRRGGLK